MLTLSNISKIYKNKHRLVHALDDINLSFPNKGLVFILGESGAGKSTLLNLISLQEKQTKGKIYIEGKDTTSLKKNKLGILRSSYFGIIFQDLNLINDFNVFQNIAIAKQIRHEEVNKEEIVQLFNKLQLDESLLYEKVGNLSGGQRQRIAIIRALIKDPKVIICDEPTGSLDSKNATSIFEILKEISKEKLVIVVSHNELLANKYADRIIKLELGHIVDDIDKNNSSLSKIDESDITNIDIDKLKTTHLNFKTTIKLAFNSFKKNIVRLIFAMFTTFISLAVFLCAFTLSTINESDVETSIYKYFDLRYDTMHISTDSDTSLIKEFYPFTSDEVNIIEENYNNEDLIFRYKSLSSIRLIYQNSEDLPYISLPINQITYLTPDQLDTLGFTLNGAYPKDSLDENIVEISISKTIFNLLENVYDMEFDDDFINDLIGKEVRLNFLNQFDSLSEKTYKIVSIIDTNFNNSFIDPNDKNFKNEINDNFNFSLDNCVFVSESFSESIKQLSTEVELISILVNNYHPTEILESVKEVINLRNANSDIENVIYNPYIYSPLSNTINHMNNLLMPSNALTSMLYIFSGALFIAVLITYSTFIIANIESRSSDIRILRSLGCNELSLYNIFALEGFFIVLILTIIAIIPYFIGLKSFVEYVLVGFPILDVFYSNSYIPIISTLAVFVVLTLIITAVMFIIKCSKKTIKD